MGTVLHLSLAYPLKPGDTYIAGPFGPQVLSQEQIDLQPPNTYMGAVSAVRTIPAAITGDAQATVNAEADRIAMDLAGTPIPVPVAAKLTIAELAEYPADQLLDAIILQKQKAAGA